MLAGRVFFHEVFLETIAVHFIEELKNVLLGFVIPEVRTICLDHTGGHVSFFPEKNGNKLILTASGERVAFEILEEYREIQIIEFGSIRASELATVFKTVVHTCGVFPESPGICPIFETGYRERLFNILQIGFFTGKGFDLVFPFFENIEFLIVELKLMPIALVCPSGADIADIIGFRLFPVSNGKGVTVSFVYLIHVYSGNIYTIVQTGDILFFRGVYFEELAEERKVFAVELPEVPGEFHIGGNILVSSRLFDCRGNYIPLIVEDGGEKGYIRFVTEMDTPELVSFVVVETEDGKLSSVQYAFPLNTEPSALKEIIRGIVRKSAESIDDFGIIDQFNGQIVDI